MEVGAQSIRGWGWRRGWDESAGGEGGGCIKVRIRCQRAAAAAAGEVKKMHLSVAQPLQGAGKKLQKIMAS